MVNGSIVLAGTYAHSYVDNMSQTMTRQQDADPEEQIVLKCMFSYQ